MPRRGLREKADLRITDEMDEAIEQLAEDTGIDRAELTRILLDHVLKYQPESIVKLVEARRQLRELLAASAT